MSRFLSPALSAVTPYTPGEQPQDQQYIKLNTNESPYLPSPRVVAAVSEARWKSCAFTPTPPVPSCCARRRRISACSFPGHARQRQRREPVLCAAGFL